MRPPRIFLSALFVLIFLLPWSCARRGDRTVPSADGVNVAYHVEGTGEPALVFVHGWSCNRSFWDGQVAVFARTHKVVAVDLAGHGASGRGRKNWTIPAFGADVAAVIKKEKLGKVILIGHSMGGDVIVEAALLCPGQVVGLVGADTFHDFNETAATEEVEGFLQPFKENFAAATAEFVRTMFRPTASPSLIAKITKAMTATRPAIAIAALKSTYLYSPAAALKGLNLPVRGIESDIYGVNIDGNRTVVPGFEVKMMPGTGHFIQIEDPATFNRLLGETIDALVNGR